MSHLVFLRRHGSQASLDGKVGAIVDSFGLNIVALGYQDPIFQIPNQEFSNRKNARKMEERRVEIRAEGQTQDRPILVRLTPHERDP